MSRNIIRDGFTRDGYIAAREGIHDELRFRFRPMLAEVVERVEDAIAKRSGPQAVTEIARETAAHLVDWSETNEGDEPLPTSETNVRRLPPALFNKLYRVVSGTVPSDDEPQSYREQNLLETSAKN